MYWWKTKMHCVENKLKELEEYNFTQSCIIIAKAYYRVHEVELKVKELETNQDEE